VPPWFSLMAGSVVMQTREREDRHGEKLKGRKTTWLTLVAVCVTWS
jgi:hypothetical protein